MKREPHTSAANCFNEYEWLKMLFMLSDMQTWLSEMEKDLFMRQPSVKKKKLFQKTYYLTASSFAHIIERHYYKIPRHIGAAKFTITLPEILDWLRTAFQETAFRPPGSSNYIRELDAGSDIGFDRSGNNTSILTVITDAGGKIITAFPGRANPRASSSPNNRDNDSLTGYVSLVREDEPIYLTMAV
jgi:hypothetical protein